MGLRTRPSGFGRSFALSLGVHGAAFGAVLLVALEAGPGARTRGEAVLLVAAAEPESAWTLEAAPEPSPSELETPQMPAPELVPAQVPEGAPLEPVTPVEEPMLASIVDWSSLRIDARPLERLERRAPPAPAEPVLAAQASAPPVARGESRPPRLLEGPAPAYPRIALRLQQQGSVLLELTIDADGRVSAVAVLESSGFERLDEAAREGVLAWRFEPALRDGAPVSERFRHRIEFVLG
jgi:protein TonB